MTNAATAIAFLKSLDSRSPATIRPYLAPAFTYIIEPTSLNLPGSGLYTTESFLAELKVLSGVIVKSGFQLDSPNTEIIEGLDSVVIKVDCKGKLSNGDPYLSTYIFIFKFDPDGLISKCNVTVDSALLNSILSQGWVKEVIMTATPRTWMSYSERKRGGQTVRGLGFP